MITATLNEIADIFGVSIQAIGRLHKADVVVKIAPGQYDVAESCKRYIALLRRRSDAPSLTEARASLAREKAALAKLQREEAEGRVAPVEQFSKIAEQMIVVARTKFLALPAKLASKFGMVTNAVELQAMAKTEVHEILHELAQLPVVVDQRMGSGGRGRVLTNASGIMERGSGE